ncbi:Uncharacterized protein family UPF0005 containing protein, partial [Aphelenchoides avenae]
MTVCFESIRRAFPCNVICTSLFTVAMGFMTMVIASYHQASYVLMALVITVVVSLAATLFATQTKYDFTRYGSIVPYKSYYGTVWGWVALHVKACYIVFAFLGAVFFTVWLIYDIQIMIGGRNHEISPE